MSEARFAEDTGEIHAYTAEAGICGDALRAGLMVELVLAGEAVAGTGGCAVESKGDVCGMAERFVVRPAERWECPDPQQWEQTSGSSVHP